MLLNYEPFYNNAFGTMGRTLDTARASGFFGEFHLVEIERRPEWPGQTIRFRPLDEKFRDVSHLDLLVSENGDLLVAELIVHRSFIEGNEGIFAQEVLSRFLLAAMSGESQTELGEFMQEMNTTGSNGETTGYFTFRGRVPLWRTETRASMLILANLVVDGVAALVVQVSSNPVAPGAKFVAEKRVTTGSSRA